MRNLIKIVFIFLLINFSCTPQPSIYRRKGFTNSLIRRISIGIVEINGYESNTAENKISEQFLLRGIKIVERSKIQKILQEHGFQQAGFVDQQTAVEIGKIIGVPTIFIGSVSSPSMSNVANLRDNTWNSFTVTFTGRIISVKTGEIFLSGSASSKRGFPNYAMLDSIEKFFREIFDK